MNFLQAPGTPANPPSGINRIALGVFALALLVRIIYISLIAGTGCLAINQDSLTDMESFHGWAVQIQAGDWTGRQEFHPYHPWQRAIATESEWLGWYGPRVFHQDPLYPYLIALVYTVAPAVPMSMIGVQLLLGALTAAGISLLAARLFGTRAALASGLLAALYAPFIFYESLLLRDTLLVTLTTFFLLWLEKTRHRPSPARWTILGAIAGTIYLTKASILLFVIFLAVWLAVTREISSRRKAAALFCAGFIIAVLPAVVRNVAVGAPPLKTTTRGAIEFINGNNPYHRGIGWFDGDDPRVSAYARDVLHRSDARLVSTIAIVLESWRGRLPELAGLQFRKLAYLFAPFEMPNNASFSYFRLNSPVLGAGLPTFWIVSPLAMLGLIVTAPSYRRLAPHYAFLGIGFLVTVAFYVIARFRIPFLPLILVFAGAGALALVELARTRRWSRLLMAVGLVVSLLALNTATTYPDQALVTPQDYVVASRDFAARGELERASAELDAGLEIFSGITPLWISAARLREDLGDFSGAIRAWEEVSKLHPRDAGAEAQIQRLKSKNNTAP
jgi:4-amino-4-deoxy-L-arabinose transferase-like glycosyltransferase